MPGSVQSDAEFTKIVRFNEELNSWDYGILINGEKMTSEDIDFAKYKTIPVKDVEFYHVGTCWDFVNYEAKWFSENSCCEFKTFFVYIDDDEGCPSHTFLVFEYQGKCYYFESAWFKYQGIQEFDSYVSAVQFVVKRHLDESDPNRRYPFSVFEYATDGLDSFLSPLEFMNFVEEHGTRLEMEDFNE